MSRVDLHTHSTASDGTLTPTELVELATARDVTTLALTDHDTTAGIAEATAAGLAAGVAIVPGVEINTDDDWGGQTDILGYFIDERDAEFQALLLGIREARTVRAQNMTAKLRNLGAEITMDDVMRHAGTGAVGRPHVAAALRDAGFVTSIGEAFERYIGLNGPAYADRFKMSPAEACTAVRAAGGVPSMAHPVPPDNPFSDPKNLRQVLPSLCDAGLGGLECFYPGYTTKVVRWLVALADHFGLVPTGGSDYHGPWREEHRLGSVNVPPETVELLRAAAGRA